MAKKALVPINLMDSDSANPEVRSELDRISAERKFLSNWDYLSMPDAVNRNIEPTLEPIRAAGSIDYSAGYDPSAGETQSDVGSILGDISSVSSMLPGIGSIISGVTGAGALIMNWWAASKQMEENKRARAAAQDAYNKEQAENRRRYDTETAYKQQVFDENRRRYNEESALTRRKLATSEKMANEQLAMSKEDRQWSRYMNLVGNMTNMLSTPGKRAGLAQTYAAVR